MLNGSLVITGKAFGQSPELWKAEQGEEARVPWSLDKGKCSLPTDNAVVAW